MKLLTLVLFSVALCPAAILRVGTGQTYATIALAVAASACGDVIEINAASTGDTFTGATAPVVIGKQAGTCLQYTTIRSSSCGDIMGRRVTPADASKMAAIRVSGTGTTLVDVDQTTVNLGAGFWRLQCLDIGLTGTQYYYWLVNFRSFFQSQAGQVDLNQLPHHIIFESNYIHAPVQDVDIQNRCLQDDGGYMEIRNNYFEGCYNPGYKPGVGSYAESQAIAGFTSYGTHYITNNYMEAGAQCIIFGGSKPQIMGVHPSLIFEGNDCHRPWTWKVREGTGAPSGACFWETGGGEHYNRTDTTQHYDCQSSHTWGTVASGLSSQPPTYIKNGVETKNSTKSRFRGNTIRNVWLPTFGSQNGSCGLDNQVDGYLGADEAVNAFIEWLNNKCIDTASGIVQAQAYAGVAYYQADHDLTIKNNVFQRMGAVEMLNGETPPGTSIGFRIGVIKNANLSHNTIISSAPTGIGMMTDFALPLVASGVSVSGNLLSYMGAGFWGNAGNLWGGVASGLVAKTHSWGGNAVVNDAGCVLYGYACPETVLRMDTTLGPGFGAPGTGFQMCSSCSTLADYAAADLVNFSTGDYHPNTTSPLYQKADSRLNIGADIDETDNMTACAISGCVNPFLDFNILNLTIGSTTASLRYFAYSTEACVVTVGTDPDFVPASAEFQATSATGQRDRVASITSLASKAMHYLDIDCTLSGTHYHKQIPFITR